ncbi:type IX secretion system protein PorG [Psychroflexus salis]|uniref:DUF6089 domain-containing protein n=1 Tax=Psychroflexus salis TaxID=1526574 RepID=A0A917E7Z3_9FLAO|nr:DUF6089 family protein [Psychroflexus salis]GGE08127.1 hypothetical protein GCM10010831_07090 [Psychroflexus salis]
MRVFLTVSFLVVFLSSSLHAQTYEVGVMIGGTNFTGDVGSTSYVLPEDYANRSNGSFGLIFKWNRSVRHSFRFSILRARTYGDDRRSRMNRRIARNYRFNQDMTEISAGIEYTFWDWDPHEAKTQITPYLATGPTYFFAHHHFARNNRLAKGEQFGSFAIPMIFGVKVNIATHWVLAGEFGARYTFTDNLDGSNPSEINGETNFTNFGNPNTNDWYMFAGFTLTYSFGRKPCYCNF